MRVREFLLWLLVTGCSAAGHGEQMERVQPDAAGAAGQAAAGAQAVGESGSAGQSGATSAHGGGAAISSAGGGVGGAGGAHAASGAAGAPVSVAGGAGIGGAAGLGGGGSSAGVGGSAAGSVAVGGGGVGQSGSGGSAPELRGSVSYRWTAMSADCIQNGVVGISVYVKGTGINDGLSTDTLCKNGGLTLEHVPAGVYQVVSSFVGQKTSNQSAPYELTVKPGQDSPMAPGFY